MMRIITIHRMRHQSNRKRRMSKIVLGIETSCDETAIAVVQSGGKILSHCLRTQTAEHKAYGGVVPEIAARAHLDYIPILFRQCLADAAISIDNIDAVGVTAGPGLIGGLLVGIGFAESLAWANQKPIYAINHLEAHALTARLTNQTEFPFLLLLVSGGHSQFISVEGVGCYRKLGSTMDDAVGEAFDKAAKILGLGFPGGPQLERMAKNGDPRRFELPIPLLGRKGCDLSLSGLKTALRHVAMQLPQPLSPQDVADLAAGFQYAVGEMLADRLNNAISIFDAMHKSRGHKKTIAIAGGVAANIYLQKRLQNIADRHNWVIVTPPQNLCGDNGVMVAWAAIERMMADIAPDPCMIAYPRWPLETMGRKSA